MVGNNSNLEIYKIKQTLNELSNIYVEEDVLYLGSQKFSVDNDTLFINVRQSTGE